ncbi:nucleotidyltransferase family protein [Brevundimonas sp.]|uniref:nucleotidyltransferase domain-containing protein n=1 Tax=Brevundimonas sp. TaxID=1871086 RepID=UPI002ABCB6AC|nr:nucleotidyltransferase family protein [Brevundimonas sp.]MDZ4363866.1 nucleotidyltransferase family protein [Brevundimonas sp.]
MTAISAELALAAACCRRAASAQRDAAVISAADAGIDWSRFARVLARHRITALALDGLRQAGVAPPEPVANRLKSIAIRETHRSLAMAAETAQLQKACDAAGLPCAFVKGATLAALAYGDAGIKKSHDIDLLTTPQAAVAVRALLEGRGYRMTLPADLDAERFRVLIDHHKEAAFVHGVTGHMVDLHWRLLDQAWVLPGVDVADAVRTVGLGGVAVRTLPDPALFAYLCVHGAAHAWNRLKWSADLNAFLSHQSAQTIEALHVTAVAMGAGRAPTMGLILCQRLYGLTVSPTLAQRLKRDRIAQALADNALACLNHGQGAVELPLPYSLPVVRIKLAQLFLMPGAGHLKRELARRMNSPDDRINLGLPPALSFLYLPLRVPLWLMRHGRALIGRR